MNELVFNQPIETGPIRAEFFGDTEKAKSYITAGRKILGAVRTFNGVNQRIAEGEAGGFYRHLAQLEDGTQIEVLTNNGMDTVRIYAVPETTAPKVESEIDKPDEEPTPIPLGGYRPYIWIGVRYISGGVADDGQINQWQLNVWEPGDHAILSNSIVSLRNNAPKEGNAIYPLGNNNFQSATATKPFIRYNDNNLIVYADHTDEGGIKWDQVVVGDDDDSNPQMHGFSTDLVAGDYLASVSMQNRNGCDEANEPMVLEIKIIIGKDEHRIETTEKLTIVRGSHYGMATYPYGCFAGVSTPQSDGCPYEPDNYGENPHGENWAQDIIAASLPPLQADTPLDLLFTGAIGIATELPAGFSGGFVPTPLQICPVVIYTFYVGPGGALPSPCGGYVNSSLWSIGAYGDYYKYVLDTGLGYAPPTPRDIQSISAEEFGAFLDSGDAQTAGTHGSGCGLFHYEC